MKSQGATVRFPRLSAIPIRTRILAGAFAALVALYLAVFTDRFNPAPIQMAVSIRGITPKKLAKIPIGNVLPVAFSLDAKYRLTSVQVFEDEAANGPGSPTAPLWHLKSGFFGSYPTKMVLYGLPVPWMKPASTTQLQPKPLIAGKKYRLVVHSGRRKGEVTFTPAPSQNPSTSDSQQPPVRTR